MCDENACPLNPVEANYSDTAKIAEINNSSRLRNSRISHRQPLKSSMTLRRRISYPATLQNTDPLFVDDDHEQIQDSISMKRDQLSQTDPIPGLPSLQCILSSTPLYRNVETQTVDEDNSRKVRSKRNRLIGEEMNSADEDVDDIARARKRAMSRMEGNCRANIASFLPAKRFLTCGLYASDLKADRGTMRPLARVPVFPLPMHFGLAMLQTETEFCLPFDLLLEYHCSLLVVRKQSPTFVRIKSNIYVERKRRSQEHPIICQCKAVEVGLGVWEGCKENCLNRLMYIECMEETCPCGSSCQNQNLQNRNFVNDLEVFFAPEKNGFGLRTRIGIPSNALITEYCGEVISQRECRRRMMNEYAGHANFYFLDIGYGEVIDATMKGNRARFVNHGCDPNCRIERWHVDGEIRVALAAIRRIEAGEELCYDYNFCWFDGAEPQQCMCGAANCRGFIGLRPSATVIPAQPHLTKKETRKMETRRRPERRTYRRKPANVRDRVWTALTKSDIERAKIELERLAQSRQHSGVFLLRTALLGTMKKSEVKSTRRRNLDDILNQLRKA